MTMHFSASLLSSSSSNYELCCKEKIKMMAWERRHLFGEVAVYQKKQ
jgi:hypothetical protein